MSRTGAVREVAQNATAADAGARGARERGHKAAPTVAVASTLTVRAFFRRASFWVGAAIFVVIAAVVLMVIRGGSGSANTDPLSITSAAPSGAKALAEVLRQHGVTVIAADSLDAATAAATADSTVVIYDPSGNLPVSRERQLTELSPRLLLIEPSLFELADLAPTVSLDRISWEPSVANARCSLPASQRADAVSLNGTGATYRLDTDANSSDNAGDASSECFKSFGGGYALVRTQNAGQTVTVFGSAYTFDNEHIVEAGNAALALGLLGESSSVVWYLPTAADVSADGPPSLGALTPGWVTPSILLLVLVFLAAAVWRGRRLGPLVVENLPVVVRGSETVSGRARLYARSGARTRALDALRIGTIGRLGVLLGLSRSASLDEVIVAVSVATGSPPQEVAATLVGTLPSSEADLVELSARLAALERAVRTSLGRGPDSSLPNRTTPDEGTRR